MRSAILSAAAAGALIIGGCASNRAGEGAIAGGAIGAGVGALSGDVGVVEGAAIGAAAGAIGGALIKKNGRCYRTNSNGYRYRVRCR